MKISKQSTDEAILAELGTRLAGHRLSRNLSQESLARESGVSKRTVERIESGCAVQTPNLIRVLRTLDFIEHIELLIPWVDPSPIQKLKLKNRLRKRASSTPPDKPHHKPWKWGDER
jgi:transcriptional regulator with XRE-family HTH domain